MKTLSEGSDCQCKCVVRPLSRSACKRIEEGHAKAEDFYTVETITVGPSCKKCACIAPPSALNPCEGDFRFKKLQEAGRDDIKVKGSKLNQDSCGDRDKNHVLVLIDSWKYGLALFIWMTFILFLDINLSIVYITSIKPLYYPLFISWCFSSQP